MTGKWEGPDVNLEISLREYGVVWKWEDPFKDAITFITGYQVENDEYGEPHFCTFYMTQFTQKEWVEEHNEEFTPYNVYDHALRYGWDSLFPPPYPWEEMSLEEVWGIIKSG